MVAAGFIKARDQMSAAWPSGAGAHTKLARELRLACGGERRALLMTHANPFDITSSHRIGKRIQRVADESEYVFDAHSSERSNQDLSYRFGHGPSPNDGPGERTANDETQHSTMRQCALEFYDGVIDLPSGHRSSKL